MSDDAPVRSARVKHRALQVPRDGGRDRVVLVVPGGPFVWTPDAPGDTVGMVRRDLADELIGQAPDVGDDALMARYRHGGRYDAALVVVERAWPRRGRAESRMQIMAPDKAIGVAGLRDEDRAVLEMAPYEVRQKARR